MFPSYAIEIRDEVVETTKGRDNQTGREWTNHRQVGWLHLPEKPYPTEIQVNVEDARAYPRGIYELDEASIYVGAYGRLKISPRLKPHTERKSQQPSGTSASAPSAVPSQRAAG